MSDLAFRELLDFHMCDDPSILPTKAIEGALAEALNAEAQRHGYDDWIDAYHQFKPITMRI